MKVIIIDGSHRKNGNTTKVSGLLAELISADVKHLIDFEIGHYDYEFGNAADDFIPFIREVATYDLIVLATPVYWYTMSGRLKVFLDRISDCLKTEKEIGRSLAGKSLAVLSCGSEDLAISGFFEPFRLTAAYLDMEYKGDVTTWIGAKDIEPEVQARVEAFAAILHKS